MSVDPYLPGHGDKSYDVTHYDLDLEYAVGTNQLRGVAKLTVVPRDDVTRLRFDLHRLMVEKVFVGTAKATWRHREGHLLVDAKLKKGTKHTVTVRYRGKPGIVHDVAGDAGWEELEDGAVAACQPGGAPAFFPCNDRATNKATYTFTVQAPSDYFVVCNGNRVAQRRQASTTTWRYEQTHPISPYLACVSIGRYTEISQDAIIPLAGVVPPEHKASYRWAFGDLPAMVAYFSKLFGPYPFSSYRAVVVADSLDIPLEAGGLATFGRNFLDREWSSQRLIAHELAHQWWGNSVTAKRWSDIWLHEGFACYCEWLWSEKSDGWDAHIWAKHYHDKLSKLPQNLTLGDPGPEDMFDDRVYKRGALTLHALRLRMGDVSFFKFLRSWATENAYGVVTSAQFEEAASVAAGTRLDSFFDAWLRSKKLPPLK